MGTKNTKLFFVCLVPLWEKLDKEPIVQVCEVRSILRTRMFNKITKAD
jgi:hypothetical protein